MNSNKKLARKRREELQAKRLIRTIIVALALLGLVLIIGLSLS